MMQNSKGKIGNCKMETTPKKCRRRSLRNLRRSSSSYVIPARALLDASTEDGPFREKIVNSPYGSAWLGENTIEKLVNSSNSTPFNLETESKSIIAISQVDTDKISSTSPTDECNESFVTDRSFKVMPPSPSSASPLNTSSLSYQMNEFKDFVDKNQNPEWKPLSFQGLFSEKMDMGLEIQTLKSRKSIERLRCPAKATSPKAKKNHNNNRVHGAQICLSKSPTLKIAPSSIKASKERVKSDKRPLYGHKNCTVFNNPTINIPISGSFKKSKGPIVNANSSKIRETVFSRSSLASSSTSLNSFSGKIRPHAALCRPSTSQSDTAITDNIAAEHAGLVTDTNVKSIIHQLSSKLQALQTGMVKNRKITSESKQDREESILPKKLRRKSEVPDIKRHTGLTFCSKVNYEHSILTVEKSKKRKQLSLRKTLPAFMVPNATITDVATEKLTSTSSNLSSPAAMTTETTVVDVAGERSISVKSNVESNIVDNHNQIPCDELHDNQMNGALAGSDNGYVSGTYGSFDFEMTEELLKSFDLPVFNVNLSMGPDLNSEKRMNKKDKLRRSSRYFTLYEMPLSRPSLEAQSEVEELSNQNSSSSITFVSPEHTSDSNIINPENSSPQNKYTGNKENVPHEETIHTPTQKCKTLVFSNDLQTSSEADNITIEEMTENFNGLFVDENHDVTRSNKVKEMKAKTNQRKQYTNVFKACSENIMYDLNFHNDNVIPQNYDKTQHVISDCMVSNSLISDLEIVQDGGKVNVNNGTHLKGEENFFSGFSGDQNTIPVGDVVMQDIAGSDTFCDLKAKEDMDTSEESVPTFTKVLRNRKSWDFSQVSVHQENKVTRRKHKVSETFTPTASQNNSHLGGMASSPKPSQDKSKDDISPGLKDLYLNKNVVLPKPKTWETIKENPSNNQSIFTKQKFKRILLFEAGVSASKLQRRHKKASQLSKGSTTRVTISDQDFEKKLLDLDLELMLDC